MTSLEAVFPDAGPSSASAHLRPHLVELIPQEQLRLVLHPVFRYVLTYLAHRNPRYFLRIVNRHEEAFAALLLLIERHHLWKHDASLSEYFYGLRLVPDHIPTQRLGSIQPVKTPRLSSKQRWGMLVVLVGIPYLRARLDDAYDRWSAQEDPELAPEDQIELNTTQRTFVRLYPWLSTAFEASLLAYDLAYLFNKTPYFRPWHKLLGVRVERRVDEDDPNAAKTILQKFPPLLPPLLLALKFAQWWYSPVSPRSLPTTKETTSQHTSVLPPRPLPILPDAGLLSEEDKEAAVEGYSINPESFGHCPICKGKWQNPAILPSGWVVCWRCGWDAISGEGEKGEEGKGRCPITGVAVHPSELRRVLV